MTRRQWMAIALLVLVLFAAESLLVRRVYTTHTLGGNDFYPRWAGARAYFLEGRDPYSPALTEEIAAVLDPLNKQTNSFSFAYPFHVIYVMGFLAFLPYEWAYTVWIVTLKWIVVALVAVLLLWQKWRPTVWVTALLFLGTLAFYPVTRSIILGQFTLHITLFVAVSLLALRREHDGWAGIFLAATSIKPQLVIFVAPWLLLWAWRQQRWRFFAGFFGAGLLFLLSSLAIFPRWPLSFVEDIPRYSSQAGGREPLAILGNIVLPSAGRWFAYTASFFLLAGMAWSWLRSWRLNAHQETALYWAIVAGLLVPFQTGSTNQVLLLIPFFAWLAHLREEKGVWPMLLATGLAVLGMWLLFIRTFAGESPLMFLPLPLVALAVLLGQTFQGRLTFEKRSSYPDSP